MLAAERRDITLPSDGRRIGVARRGDGPPVVLVHSLAMAGRMWEEPARRLAQDFEVWTYDVHGHGESEATGRGFSVEDLARELAEVLDVLGIERTSLVGMSMGGCVATAFAIAFPHRLAALVLADTTACYGPEPERHEAWERRAQMAVSKPREEQLDFQFDRWFTPGFREHDPETVRRIGEIFVACDSEVHASACRALGGFDARASLGSVEAPTLVLVGEDDQATPVAMAEELAAGIPGATLSVVPGARHMALIERPELADRIAEFLARAT